MQTKTQTKGGKIMQNKKNNMQMRGYILSLFLCVCISLGSISVSAFSLNISTEKVHLDTIAEEVSEKVIASSEGFFSRVVGEIKTFVRNGLDDIAAYARPSSEDSEQKLKATFAKMQTQTPSVNYAPVKEKQYFQDVEFHTYADAINLIARLGFVNTTAKKFNPDNFVRLHEGVKILEHVYDYLHPDATLAVLQEEQKQQQTEGVGSGGGERGTNNTQNMPEYYILAENLQLLEGIMDKNDFEQLLDEESYLLLLENFSKYDKAFSQNIKNIGDTQEMYYTIESIQGAEKIRRGVFAHEVVNRFDLKQLAKKNNAKNNTKHNVKSNSRLQDHDTTLRLGGNEAVQILIANTMYPFADIQTGKVSRGKFAQFLAQVSSIRNAENLADFVAQQRGGEKYVDIEYSQQGYMYYLDQKRYLDYLTEIRRGKKYLYPERKMTQYEVYYILEQFCDKKREYDEKIADKALVDYDRLSERFVQCIAAHPQEKGTDQKQDKQSSKATGEKAPILSLWGGLVQIVDD